MGNFHTTTGFHDAVQAAVELGAFEDMGAVKGSPIAEYRRGIVELIGNAFMRGDDDMGTGERYAFVERMGRMAART